MVKCTHKELAGHSARELPLIRALPEFQRRASALSHQGSARVPPQGFSRNRFPALFVIMEIRPASLADIDTVHRLQIECHPPHLHEGVECFRAILEKNTSFLTSFQGEVVGYALTHPISDLDSPPALDELEGDVFSKDASPSDVLFFHDVSVQPDRRGLGFAKAIVLHLERALGSNYRHFAAISLPTACAFWRKLGFIPYPLTDLVAISSYGAGCVYLWKENAQHFLVPRAL